MIGMSGSHVEIQNIDDDLYVSVDVTNVMQ
jgi:hypothetical protein